MATWAIGDIQGCMSSLEQLLERIDFVAGRDQLWLVGDLVNRGPRSLDVLRWASGLGDAVAVVLGNHDLHLLGRIAGTVDAKKRDTLDAVLAAPDRDALADWLRRRPLLHSNGEHLMVHAGLHPKWSVKRARALAGEIEAGLAGDDWKTWIKQLHGKPVAWDDDLDGGARVRGIVGFFAKVRMLDADTVPDFEYDGPPDAAPRALRPWFAWPDPKWADQTVLFGHWSAMGLAVGPRHLGLDTGCVWGRQLTAVRLPDRKVVQVDAAERA